VSYLVYVCDVCDSVYHELHPGKVHAGYEVADLYAAPISCNKVFLTILSAAQISSSSCWWCWEGSCLASTKPAAGCDLRGRVYNVAVVGTFKFGRSVLTDKSAGQ